MSVGTDDDLKLEASGRVQRINENDSAPAIALRDGASQFVLLVNFEFSKADAILKRKPPF